MFSITTFGKVLKGLPRNEFDRLVARLGADKYCKKFRHWNHLVAMLYAQFSGASGLRPLEATFNQQAAHHYHLGVSKIRRSTLADANETRGDAVFSATAAWLMGKMSGQLRQEARDFLYLLDSSSITLKGREFDRWTKQHRTRNTQGIKLHLLIDARDQVPLWHHISAANVNDVEIGRTVPLQEQACYVFDKGYCDYNWWHKINSEGARFVTRFKNNAKLELVEERPIDPAVADTVLGDHVVRLANKCPGAGRKNHYSSPLRRIVVARPDKQRPLVLATNDMTAPAAEIARRYKERWGIELFFKWVKQHLKIKQFFGRSENAVRIQLLTALISYLLVAIYKHARALPHSLWECLCMISTSLFQRPALEESRHRRRKREQEELARIQLRLL
jgi:putative transposase